MSFQDWMLKPVLLKNLIRCAAESVISECTDICGLSYLACDLRRFECLLIFSVATQRHLEQG
jgi:hypothetical protein